MISKRIFDLIFTIPGLIVLSPLLLVIACWIKLDSEGPIFFKQERVGKNGKLFKVMKFRTMISDAEKIGPLITTRNDCRITRVGIFLRRTKLDELPQLLNVIKGEMSLVGPRPEVPKYVEHYPDDIREKVLSVLPGITDMASIEFKNENSLLESSEDSERTYIEDILPIKLNYYIEYVKNRSILGDIMLIFRTIIEIISSRKISND